MLLMFLCYFNIWHYFLFLHFITVLLELKTETTLPNGGSKNFLLETEEYFLVPLFELLLELEMWRSGKMGKLGKMFCLGFFSERNWKKKFLHFVPDFHISKQNWGEGRFLSLGNIAKCLLHIGHPYIKAHIILSNREKTICLCCSENISSSAWWFSLERVLIQYSQAKKSRLFQKVAGISLSASPEHSFPAY